jgi:UDP-N-acetylmuramate: L-alanyl-gamma-D-glutamyl-meso-diaminopimelate ligase
VIEGDEYDSAFFEKTPKFWHYQPEVAIIQAIEYDHADIYPDMASYRAAFEEFARRLPAHGVLVANAADPEVRAVAKHAACRVSYYAVDGEDTGEVMPEWLIAPAPVQGGLLPFDLFLGGTSCGRFFSPIFGSYNLKNAVAALALSALATGAELPRLGQALTQFAGVKRRQELRGTADGVRVYDDFAHHPTAVLETLQGFRARHLEGKLIAVFEPRSATASRRIHQDAYAHAFGSADEIMLAPVGRSEIPEAERLDLVQLQRDLVAAGKSVFLGDSIDALVQRIAAVAQSGDTVVAMSNGAFGQIHDKVLCSLACRARRAAE